MTNSCADGIVISPERPGSLDELIEMEGQNFGGSPVHQPAEELSRMAYGRDYLFVGARLGRKTVGYCAGSSLETELAAIPDLPAVREKTPAGLLKKAAYVESWECMPKFQGKGIGSKLLGSFIAAAREKGFTHLAAHFRQGRSYDIALKSLKEILVDVPVPDYYGTGETYHYVIAKI